jgi:hypothetical protein
MIRRAYQDGAYAALKRFNVREGSLMDTIQTALPFLAAGVAKTTAKTLAPGAFAKLDQLQEMPGKFLRRNLMPAHMQTSPADALMRHLETAQPPPLSPHMMGIR